MKEELLNQALDKGVVLAAEAVSSYVDLLWARFFIGWIASGLVLFGIYKIIAILVKEDSRHESKR